MPISEQRKLEIQAAKVSLVEEHGAFDEAVQNEIRKEYSLSQEVSILRKEVGELKSAILELLQIEKMDSDNSAEFDEYHAYVEDCKKSVKETYQDEERANR